jgi:hypothetical protein
MICVSPIAGEDRLCGRKPDFAGAYSAAKAPLQFGFLFSLIPRLRPVVER